MELRAPVIPTRTPSASHGWKWAVAAHAAVALGLAAWVTHVVSPQKTSCEHQRTLAGQLKAAGASEEAAKVYEQYVQTCAHTDEAGSIALSLGDMHIASGHYDRALRWYYEAQNSPDKKTTQEAGKRVVEVLERLGRVHAANAALAENTALDNTHKAKDDPVVAEWDGHTIRRSDVLDNADVFPPQADKMPEAQKNTMLLHRYVADTLLWQKAQKLGYDQNPEVLKAEANMHRHLVTQHFIEKELFKNIHVTENDMKTYFNANKASYTTKTTPNPSFESAKKQVETDLRKQKIEDMYKTWVQEQFEAAQVKMYPEKMASKS
jgi:hypothetical protein